MAERFRQTNTWSVPTLIGYTEALATYVDTGGTLWNAEPRLFRLFWPRLFWRKATQDFWAGLPVQPGWLRYKPDPKDPDIPGFYALRIAAKAGLPIAAGTDASPGFSLHAELAMLQLRGLTTLAALQAATLNPAKLLRATDSLGTVAAGKLADLVLLDANPLEDITNTTTIRAVVANGRYFDRAALDGLLAEARAARGKP